MMRRSISQVFTSPTPQAELKQREEELQARERERVLFLALQGRRPVIQSSPQSQPQPIQHNQQAFTYAYEPPRPRSQIEALPPSSTGTSICEGSMQKQVAEFMELQRKMERDPARRHPMFFTDLVKRAPNGVDVGDGIGRGYVFEEEKRRDIGEARGML